MREKNSSPLTWNRILFKNEDCKYFQEDMCFRRKRCFIQGKYREVLVDDCYKLCRYFKPRIKRKI